MKPIDVDLILDCGLPMPDDVHAAALAARALAKLRVPDPAPSPPDPGTVEAQVVAACVASAEKGSAKLPDAAKLAAAAAAVEEWQKGEWTHADQVRLLKAAAAEARANVDDLLGERHPQIIGGLATELDALVVEVRDIVPKVRGLTVGAALRASDDVKTAFGRFEDLTGRYSAIRRVQALASDAAGGAMLDESHYFTTFRNLPTLYKSSYSRMHAAPPWPTGDLRDFLTWCADNPDHVLWCPTPAQRDDEYRRQIGEPVAGRAGRVVTANQGA